jgi:hypothetical protein
VDEMRIGTRITDVPKMHWSDLLAFQGNLKKRTRKQIETLKASLIKNGVLQVISLWERPGKNGNKFKLIDGHARLECFKELEQEGWEIDPVPVVKIPAKTQKEAKEILLEINAKFGKITKTGLSEFIGADKLDVVAIDDLEVLNDQKGQEEKPEVEFTEELMEKHNYVVLYFDNDVDWLQLQTILKLKTVKALDSKPGFEKAGIGRVVSGSKALEIFADHFGGVQ